MKFTRAGGRSSNNTRDHENLNGMELAVFRTRICEYHRNGHCSNSDKCPNSHCQTWQRRNPNEYSYSSRLCPEIEFIKRENKMTLVRRCSRGRGCSFAHSKEEELYHPSVYKTKMCNSFPNCTRHFCPFAHCLAEIRKPTARVSPCDPVVGQACSNENQPRDCNGSDTYLTGRKSRQHHVANVAESSSRKAVSPTSRKEWGADARSMLGLRAPSGNPVSSAPEDTTCLENPVTERHDDNYGYSRNRDVSQDLVNESCAVNSSRRSNTPASSSDSILYNMQLYPGGDHQFSPEWPYRRAATCQQSKKTLEMQGPARGQGNSKSGIRCPGSPISSSSTTASSIPSPVLGFLSPVSSKQLTAASPLKYGRPNDDHQSRKVAAFRMSRNILDSSGADDSTERIPWSSNSSSIVDPSIVREVQLRLEASQNSASLAKIGEENHQKENAEWSVDVPQSMFLNWPGGSIWDFQTSQVNRRDDGSKWLTETPSYESSCNSATTLASASKAEAHSESRLTTNDVPPVTAIEPKERDEALQKALSTVAGLLNGDNNKLLQTIIETLDLRKQTDYNDSSFEMSKPASVGTGNFPSASTKTNASNASLLKGLNGNQCSPCGTSQILEYLQSLLEGCPSDTSILDAPSPYRDYTSSETSPRYQTGERNFITSETYLPKKNEDNEDCVFGTVRSMSANVDSKYRSSIGKYLSAEAPAFASAYPTVATQWHQGGENEQPLSILSCGKINSLQQKSPSHRSYQCLASYNRNNCSKLGGDAKVKFSDGHPASKNDLSFERSNNSASFSDMKNCSSHHNDLGLDASPWNSPWECRNYSSGDKDHSVDVDKVDPRQSYCYDVNRQLFKDAFRKSSTCLRNSNSEWTPSVLDDGQREIANGFYQQQRKHSSGVISNLNEVLPLGEVVRICD